jgi:hypothetical protein
MFFFLNLIIKISPPEFTNQLKLNLFSNHLRACLEARLAGGLAFIKLIYDNLNPCLKGRD